MGNIGGCGNRKGGFDKMYILSWYDPSTDKIYIEMYGDYSYDTMKRREKELQQKGCKTGWDTRMV